MASSMVSKIVSSNAKFVASYTPPPPLMKMRQKWKAEGGKGTVIISCSDPRVVPERFLGPDFGPVAVIRNAGGRAMEAMRSIQVLNAITEIGLVVVVHHTDCGTTHVKDDDVRAVIRANAPDMKPEIIASMKFGEINNLEDSIREDVAMIRSDEMFGGKSPAIVGLLYEVETGKLMEIGDNSHAKV